MSRDGESARCARERLASWYVPARRAAGLGLLLQLAGIAAWIAIAFGLGRTIGAAAEGSAAPGGLLLAALGVILRAASAWLAEEQLDRAGQRIVSQARRELLSTVAAAGPAWLMGEAHGARVSQLVDRTRQLDGHAARWMPGIRLAVAGPLLVLIAVATQSWLAALLLLVSVLVLPLFIALTASGTAAQARAQQAALDELSGVFQSRAAQSGLVRAFRAVGRESAAIGTQAEALRQRTMSVLRIAFLSTAVLEFFTSVSVALVAVYVGFKLLGIFPVETGETLDLARGLTVLLLAPEFFAPIRRLAGLHHDRADANAAARFLSDWLATTPAPARRLPALSSAPEIVYHDVSLDWPDGTTAVEGLCFRARPGELTVLSGPSGAGKSAALLALLAHVNCRRGHIEVGGETLGERDSIVDSAAFIGQAPWLMEGSLLANITVARPDATVEEVVAAMTAAGIVDAGTDTEALLSRELGRFGSGLSGGQRQRVALARALLRDTPILLLDEPTAHLDPHAERAFLDTIHALKGTRTVIVATHSAAVKAAADVCVDVRPRDARSGDA